MKLILASASPRRKELFRYISEEFLVIPSDAEESIPDGVPPEKAPELIAKRKAEAVADAFFYDLVVGCDTIVLIDGKILGKPEDEQDATQMLSLLSGKTHEVITGCALMMKGNTHTFSQKTAVTFYPLSNEEIAAYIKTGEPFDKAGAYGIQEKGCLLVKEICGDYLNVVGLPVSRLKKEIEHFCRSPI